MKRFLFSIWLLALSFVANAATITGPIYLTYSNRPYTGPILIRPLSTPLPWTPNLVTGGDFKVSPDTNGLFSVDLQPGNYRVTIGADRPFTIDVPTNAATYTLLERITNALSWNSSILPYTNVNAIALTTRSGTVKASSDQGDPIAWLTNETATIGARIGQLTFATVDDMIAAAVPVYNNVGVYCLGRNSANDGGGGQFVWKSSSTTTTNKGTIFQSSTTSTGRYERIWDQSNALADWFGANPSDSIDDISAIQAAVDLMHSLKRGNVVFRAGQYYISDSIRLKYRVNLIGADGWKYSELNSTNPSSDLYMLGGATHIVLSNNSTAEAMVIMDATDGYVRQSSEVIEDGTTVDSRFQESLVKNLLFNGRTFSQTQRCDGILARNKWNITIENCGFIFIRGRPFVLFDCNGVVVNKVWTKGSVNSYPNLGSFIYSCSDSIFSDITAFGFIGPAIWVDSTSCAINVFDNLVLGNSFVGKSSYDVLSVSSGQWTVSGSDTWLSTGDPVELRTTGTLPSGFSDTQLYFLVKLGSEVYGLHTNRVQATNGVYLTTSGSGTGTHTITVGPASGLYVSGGANGNTFNNVRADQNSGPGITLRNALYNTFHGPTLSENQGTKNGETIDISEQVGIRFDKGALDNIVLGATIRYQEYGFQTRFSAARNWMHGTYQVVTTPTSGIGTNPSNKQFVYFDQNNLTTLGDSITGTSLALVGNTNGTRVLTMERPSSGYKIGLGVANNGFNFWNETGGYSIGSLTADTSFSRLQFGSASATPRQSEISGEAASGSDTAGANLVLSGGTGTGNATGNGGLFVYTSDAGSSGSTPQTQTLKVAVPKEGQLSLRKSFTSDPSASVSNGDIWYRSDLGKLRIRRNDNNDNVATEQNAYLTNVGISGTFYYTNTAPQLNFDAANGSSGARFNITGGSPSTGILRIQTNGTTSQAFFGDGSMTLYGSASEPATYEDGKIWYRTDTDKFRVRANGVTENLATESYVTSAISGSGALTDGDKTDITVSGTGTVFTIDNSAVTYSKMQNVSATSRLLGRNASTTGPPEEITLGSGLSMSGTTLSVTGGGTGDVVGPASATDNAIARFDLTTGKLIQNSAATIADTTGDITAGKYNGVTISGSSTPTLAVTGTTTVSGANTGDQTITLTGDVTGSGTGSFSATIANSAVSNAKMANMTASTIKARVTGSTGAPEDATLSQVLDLVGSAAQGDILYRGASTWTRLGAGTTGQFLKTQGTGANPLWASVPGGGDALVANPLSQFAATTSLQLAGVISDETGSGALVFGTSPTLTTPTLGVASATTINKVALTAPATGSTLTIADGKTLTANNTLTFTGTDGSTLNVGTGGTLGTAAYTASSAYQATDAEITALAGLTSAADKVPYFTGSGTASTADFTASGRTVVSQSSVKAVFDAINGAEATVASATTTDIGAASSDKVSITGTTTITGFGTATAGIKRSGRFTGALTLTHNATSLILPGGANITTVAGDRFEAVSLGAGNWVVYNYQTATWQGTGAEVHATSPTLTTPNIGVATATSVNKLAITAPATSATLTIADGKTATVNNSITFAGTDSTTMTFPSVSASIGYLGIPQGSKSADYTLVLADAGTHILHPSSDANSRTFTIPANGSVAFPVGTAVTFYNASANSCTIAITTDTLRKAGTGTTGSVTLPQYAMATALKVTTTEWVISGNGI